MNTQIPSNYFRLNRRSSGFYSIMAQDLRDKRKSQQPLAAAREAAAL